MLDIIIGIVIGACVCIFGMWCFTQGQKNCLSTVLEKKPINVPTPITAIQNVIQKVSNVKKEKDITSYQSQIDAIRNYTAGLTDDEMKGGSYYD